MKKKYLSLLSIGVIVLVSIGLVLVIKQVQESQDTRIGAKPSGVELYLNSNLDNAALGDEIRMDIIMDTDVHEPHEVHAVEVHIKFDPSIINVSEFAIDEAYNPIDYPQLSRPRFDNTTGIASFILSVHPENEPPYFSGNSILANLTFVAVGEGVGEVAFDATTQIAANGQNVVDDTLDAVTVTIGQSTTTSPTLKLSQAIPPNPQYLDGEFSVRILADTADQDVEAVDARLVFDPAILEVVSINSPDNPAFPRYQAKDIDNDQGTIVVSAMISLPPAAGEPTPAPIVGNDIEIATIDFRSKALSSSSAISYFFDNPPLDPPNTNDSNMIQANPNGDPVDILEYVQNVSVEVVPAPSTNPSPTSPVPTNTPVPTYMPTPTPSTPTPTNTPPQSVTTKIKFQGKHQNRNVSTVPLKLTIKNANGELVVCNDNSETTCDAPLSSTSKFTVAIVPGQYTWQLSSPGYLDRTYAITIEPGVTTYDISTQPLLGGDLNNDEVVNDFDYTSFLAKFLSADTIADLDSSGEVNNYDFSVMRPNWFEESDSF